MPFRLYSPVPAPWCRNAALIALALGLGGCANFAGIGPKARMTEPQALGLGSAAPKAAPNTKPITTSSAVMPLCQSKRSDP